MSYYAGFVNHLISRLKSVPDCASPDDLGSIVAQEYSDYCDRCRHFGQNQTFMLDSWSERQLGDDFFWLSRRDELLWGIWQKISWKKVFEILALGEKVTILFKEEPKQQKEARFEY